MRIIRDKPDQQLLNSSVVTIGNFDGFHTGHQVLLDKALDLAAGRRPVVVVTFEPLPQAWFAPQDAPARLMSVRQKLCYLAAHGVSLVWLMRFNQTLASMGPDEFVQRILLETLDAGDVVVGDDFHYGRHRQGDAGTLKAAGKRSGFKLSVVSAVEDKAVRVSSSAIRESLAEGRLQDAERLLGRPFRTEGRVIKGQQLGRALGYPTANMKPTAIPCPIQGIFAVRVRLCDAGGDSDTYNDSGSTGHYWHDGVASVGMRPAVDGSEFLIEVHLFDFDGDLYGRRMEVEYVEKLRNEAHFTELDDLVAQMREDERLARRILLGTAIRSLSVKSDRLLPRL